MGCGGSTPKPAEDKYKKDEPTKKGTAKETGGDSKKPTAGGKVEDEPQTNPVSPGTPGKTSKPPPHDVTVVHATHRLECKFGDTELENRQQLWQIIRGQNVIERGPPPAQCGKRCNVTVRTDFGGDINLILREDEATKLLAQAAKVKEQKESKKKKDRKAAADAEFEAREMLVSRAAVAPKLMGLRVQTLRGHPKQVQVATLSPNDWLLVTSGSSLIGVETAARCSDIRTCLQVGVLDGKRKDVHDPIAGAAFTTDGQQLATVHKTDQLLIWDMNTFRTKKLIQAEQGDNEVRLSSVATSPDMKLIGAAAELLNESDEVMGAVPIYDFSGDLVNFFSEHQAAVSAVAFSPDSLNVLSGSSDGGLFLWTARTGEVIKRFEGHTDPIRAVAFSPDGDVVLALDDKHLTAWNAGTAEPVWTRPIAGEAEAGKSPAEVSPPESTPARLRFTTVCLAASGVGFLGMTDRKVTVFDVTTGQEVDTVTTKAPVTAMSAGCRACALGDVWGNLYLVHIV
eukprot:Hpha_TRINITY_DN1863_c0_g1::TRINITY_DN1863_c0_g1_i1::g.170601::m.170601